MKALEILRDDYITVVSDTEMALYKQDHIQIAIKKELEELNNRSCKGCSSEHNKARCEECSRFHLDRYEANLNSI